jgi:hypothetical protein
MVCNIWGSHSGDCAGPRLLGYKNPLSISQGTHYISATEPIQLRVEVSTAVAVKNVVFWDVTSCGSRKNRHFNMQVFCNMFYIKRWKYQFHLSTYNLGQRA